MSWKVLEILKALKSSIGPQEVIKSSWKVLQWSESIRSSGLHNVLKRSTKSSRNQENAEKVPKVFRPQVLNWSSKCPQFPRKVIKALEVHRGPQKVFKTTSNSSKSYQRPQNPVIVKSSSNCHQMVLTKSSKFPKNSPQKVHKKSSKFPQRFFNVLKASGHQFFKKSSKGPQNPQKFKKMHKRYPRSSQSSGSQLILKMSSISSKGPQSPRCPQRSAKGIQNDLKFLKKLSTSSKSRDRQKFLKWSSNGPHKVLKISKKQSSKGWQSPQKLKKMHKRYPRSSQSSGLNWCSKYPQKVKKMHKRSPTSSGLRPSNDPQITQKVLKLLEFFKGPQTILKSSSKSSKVYQRSKRPP